MTSSKKNTSKHPISAKHFKQITTRDKNLAERMTRLVGLTWRPGDNSSSFLGKVFRPVGSPLLIAQHSEMVKSRTKVRERITLSGYKTEIDPHQCTVHYGGADRNVFCYDFGLRPHVGAKGKIMDPNRNGSLGYVGLEIDKVRQNFAGKSFTPRVAPILPRIYLAFATDRRPNCVDSVMLRARVAKHMHRTTDDVNRMDAMMLRPLLEAEWGSCFLKPGEQENNTNLDLINIEFCMPLGDMPPGTTPPVTAERVSVTQALRVFENFEELLGAEIYNPARDLISPTRPIKNPTHKVLKQLGIKHFAAVHGDRPGDEDKGIALEKGVREALGPLRAMCSDEDVLNLILNPNMSFIPSGLNDLTKLPEEQVIELMRASAGRYAEACTDEDLLAAGLSPNKLLYAKGLCGITVVRFDPARKPASLQFGPEALKRQRTHVDLYGVKPYWDLRREDAPKRKPRAGKKRRQRGRRGRSVSAK
jgi:hypothetical protein